MLETAPPYASQPRESNPHRYRQARIQLRRAGSEILNASLLLRGPQYLVAVRMAETLDWLLASLHRAEQRVS
jgi:hypothetical protein